MFMSRNLVPPEVFDTLLDAFKLNGAEIFLCCDPSRSGPSDFHVIASPDHVRNVPSSKYLQLLISFNNLILLPSLWGFTGEI